MSVQIFLLVGHLTNWTGHNLLTDNTLKKRIQDVLVTCSVIVSDHNVKLAGHFQNLVGQCPMTDCYFQHCLLGIVVAAASCPAAGRRCHKCRKMNHFFKEVSWPRKGKRSR